MQGHFLTIPNCLEELPIMKEDLVLNCANFLAKSLNLEGLSTEKESNILF